MIKVNQVVSLAEAAKLRDVDLVGICLGDPGTTDTRVVDAGTFVALQETVGPRTSLYVDASAGYAPDSVVDAVDSLRPTYFEFTAVDSAKISKVDEQLDLLQRLTVPKIANGFFILKDDVSLIDGLEHLDRLVDAGVAYFQLEINSLVDAGFRISASNRKRMVTMFARYPCIVSDVCAAAPVPPEFGHAGVYFNLGNGRVPSYDFSDRQSTLPGVIRALRSRSGG
ncbi:hypothetical protein AB4Z09_08975 [Rhodococcus sp. TAF43]|uniref:hypothetical protein n=1 Tax=unclassified Rhodococcus (in: high G+C Gram-positive bacteria) TaxID=192944 RepID=UPI0015836045|nr:hypothetical protein [Rhodococcus sp. W8901]QKT11626.1 hypothetical protein HUN07_13555 [Rhodococcus sp. W8901]